MAGCVLKSFMYLLCICIIYVFIMYRIQKLNFQDQDLYCIAGVQLATLSETLQSSVIYKRK